MAELREVAGTLQPPQLSELVQLVLERHADAFMELPAAQMVHHAYQGGLIEHMSGGDTQGEAILPLEKKLNRSIAIAGAILHDIGKDSRAEPRLEQAEHPRAD